MLFDDGDQLEVRHVISLAHHSVSIYSGGDETPEGELFIKRNAICLSRRTDSGELAPDEKSSKPFFLFSENCSDKEDFYFALLRNQEARPDAKDNPPIPVQYEMKDIITLVQRLHSSEEHLQTRWINAVIGRVFLALYKTPEVENFVRAKITKKISRVKTPSFLSKISLRHIDMGEAAPVVTNPRLKDLTADGELIVEADVRYMGNFRIEVAATARIELGPRIKAREVNLLLAVVLKRVDGHAMVRIKPPPSNRFWVTFQSMPKIDMTIEPIVSSRQITYTVILRQIENRIKEVVAESLVFPNWDDFPFYQTNDKIWRGGIWAEERAELSIQKREDKIALNGDVEQTQLQEIKLNEATSTLPRVEKSMSMPLVDTLPASSPAFLRKPTTSSISLGNTTGSGSSSSVEYRSNETTGALQSSSTLTNHAEQSLATTLDADDKSGRIPPNYSSLIDAGTIVSDVPRANILSEGQSMANNPEILQENAIEQSSSSSVNSITSGKDVEKSTIVRPDISGVSATSNAPQVSYLPGQANIKSPSVPSTEPYIDGSIALGNDPNRAAPPSVTDKPSVTESKRLTFAAVTNAAASARKWGWNAIQRQSDQKSDGSNPATPPPLPRVMGRGRPLPPPGTPLPPPERQSKPTPISVPKRKPINPPFVPLQQKNPIREPADAPEARSYTPAAMAPLSKRRSRDRLNDSPNDDSLLVVAAPSGDSEPTTPSSDHNPSSQSPWIEEAKGIEEPDANAGAVMDFEVVQPSKKRLPHRLLSTSPEEDGPKLPSWLAAQEEEARAKSTFVDDDAGLERYP